MVLALVCALRACGEPATAGRAADQPAVPAFPVWSVTAGQTNAEFGLSAASAGDVNGDGFADIIVGARHYTHTQTVEGAAFAYYGSADGLPAKPSWAAYAGKRNANFGNSVASAGDVNRDGFDDVIVGAYSYTSRPSERNPGAVFLYLGSRSGLAPAPAWTAEGPQTNCHFGFAVAGAGDVNADGFPDLMVGARNFRENGRSGGKVFVFYGSVRGFGAVADWSFTGHQAGAELGYRLASAGDINGDGIGDVIIAARDYDTPVRDAGKVFVFHGSRDGLGRMPNWTFQGEQPYGRLGIDCAAAGDVNGDGFGDVIVGAFGEGRGQRRAGAAYVFHGGAQGLTRAHWFVECNKAGSGLGQSVNTAGDVNGDGFADVIIGAPSYSGKNRGEGRAFVFLGSADGLKTNVAWVAAMGRHRLLLGRTVAGAGDVNRDGFADVIVGALMDRDTPEGGLVATYAGSKDGPLPAALDLASSPIFARRLEPPPPPPWRQSWFWGATALAVAGAAVACWHVTTTARLKRQLRRSEQQRALEQERLRIAQDLHDHLGSNLATITLLTEVARRDLNIPAKAEAHLSNIVGTARHLTRALEEIVWAVNPRKDTIDQLVSYFSAYAEEFLKPTELRCRLDFPGELPEVEVPSETRHQLFLVFKEALTNVVKHAAASEVRIGLRVIAPCLVLTIEDDGGGFNPAAGPLDRNGLTNMRTRVERLGGRCEISSQPGLGTRIRLEVSLDGPRSAR